MGNRFFNEHVNALLDAKAPVDEKTTNGQTALHQAANVVIAQALLDHHANVNAQDNGGATPLHYAVRYTRPEVAELLLKNHANVKAETSGGETPMHVAPSKAYVDLLVKYHATVNPMDANGMTPLHMAASDGKEEVLEALLAQPSIMVNAKANGIGPTPLHIAANKQIAQLLLDHHADLTATDKDGATPLHWAAGGGKTEVMKLLLAKNAKVDAHAKNGATPLFLAAANGQTAAVKLLLENHAQVNTVSDIPGTGKLTPLYTAIFGNHEETVAVLLEAKGIDVNAKSMRGLTPLHTAAFKGYDKLASLLLEHHADVNARDNDQGTPLHNAVACGRVKIVKLLLAHGADVNAHTTGGVTPLHLAQAGSIAEQLMKTEMPADAAEAKRAGEIADEIATLLVKAGANVNIQRGDGTSLLMEAVLNNDTNLIKVLLSAKDCNVNLGTKDNLTPRHCTITRVLMAREHGYAIPNETDLVELLLDHGANINAMNSNVGTPLHFAAYQGLLDTVKVLVNHGAKLNITDLKVGENTVGPGVPPLMFACMRGYTDIVRYLIAKGATTKFADKSGGTFLHAAVNADIAKLLLDAGSNPNAQTDEGIAPLHLAVQRDDKATVKLLVKSGANVNIRTKGGRSTPKDITPLMIARSAKNQPMIALLKSLGAKDIAFPAPSATAPSKSGITAPSAPVRH